MNHGPDRRDILEGGARPPGRKHDPRREIGVQLGRLERVELRGTRLVAVTGR